MGAAGEEVAVFEASLKARITVPGAVHSYELGSEAIDGHLYPAVATADLTAQPALDYAASVAAGVAELGAYVNTRSQACPDAAFVIGGYSQGAQVAETTYNDVLTDLRRSKVVFNAPFGDPNLQLPEEPLCPGGVHTE
ncbi:cutinase family protein [Arthrobacter sp. AQ5-05]|uniref:cutinase family protein n=1 Tax=Arthrobacter sp. AQ5-05 TaxID=2184581 RepID=UPI0012B67431|nr:cutinase family protein [Arthrobacter sp. AQ5-05]